MPASLAHISHDTPMGATLIADGATFRVWAPQARAVYVVGDFNQHVRSDNGLLTRDEHGHWRGFIAGARDRHRYMFYVVGEGSEGPKRDPYARELQSPFPSQCIIRGTDFPWHDNGFVTPRFENFVIYQLHVGTFFTPNVPHKGGTLLDVAQKLPYHRRPWRHRHPADADSGVSDHLQPRAQRRLCERRPGTTTRIWLLRVVDAAG